MDINMPVMNGIDATKQLRTMNANNIIDLSKTQIYMHSAIGDIIIQQGLFDGKL
jgi:CheY-like chemotaxis protein